MAESEIITRKKRIDEKLKSPLLNWTIIHNDKVDDYSTLSGHAVEEYPTKTGPADYALFVEGKLLGIIEAKKLSVGAGNVLEQAKRYAKSVPNTVGEWRGYRVPFLYSTNGEIIFHLDVRRKGNSSYQLISFHSPQALLDKYNRDTEKAEKWLKSRPVDEITSLRPYQVSAIERIEESICQGKKTMLLAMATGERVIIVTGCINALVSRVSGTLNRYISRIT
jgi:type I restriction enzyme R subunit